MAGYKIENLSFKYNLSEKFALSDINLEIKDGEILVLCGKSGCGKSTLLRHLKSCITPHGKRTGRIYFDGRLQNDVSDKEQASRIGFVFQHPDDQIVTDKVWHELAFGLENLGENSHTIRVRVGEMASYFGINSLFDMPVHKLSGGQKQLLNLAAVLAMRPDCIVLDEPTSQLDPISAGEFLNTLKKINGDLGITVVLSEHRPEDVFPIADRVAVMENGRIIMCDNPHTVAEKTSEDSALFPALPTASRMYRQLARGGTCPLTVKEGRAFLHSMHLEKDSAKLHVHIEKEKGDTPLMQLSECMFRYNRNDKDVLYNFSLSIRGGEMLALLGANGSGKSTALSLMSGVHVPYSGRICLNGKRIKRLEAKEHGICALPQDPRVLFTKESVEEELQMTVNGCEDKKSRLAEVIDVMELNGLLHMHPFDISGGEQERVALAKVLLMSPRIMLLDEPTKGMDAAFKRKFGEYLRSEMQKNGTAIVIVSHDIEFCAEFSHRCGLLFNGELIAEDVPQKFFCGNHFYTTSANKIARDYFPNAILCEEVTQRCKSALNKKSHISE